MPVNFAPCVAPCATVGLLSHRLKPTLSQAGAVPSGATCASPRCASHSLRLAVASAEQTLSQAWGNTSPTSSRRVRQSRTRRRWAAAHPAPKAKGLSDRPLETFGPIEKVFRRAAIAAGRFILPRQRVPLQNRKQIPPAGDPSFQKSRMSRVIEGPLVTVIAGGQT